MSNGKLRQRIAWEAARLMYERTESEYYRAKLKAARRMTRGWVKPKDLPSNREIRDEIQVFARLYEGDRRLENLREITLGNGRKAARASGECCRVASVAICRRPIRPQLCGSCNQL